MYIEVYAVSVNACFQFTLQLCIDNLKTGPVG